MRIKKTKNLKIWNRYCKTCNHRTYTTTKIYLIFSTTGFNHVMLIQPRSIFFQSCFFSRTLTIHRTAGEGGGCLFNSSLPLPPTSQKFRHQRGNYCRELTSEHSQQPKSNREPLVSKHKSLFTKLRALSALSASQ